MGEKELSEGWAITEIYLVGTVVTGNTPSKNNLEFYNGEFPWVKPGDINKTIYITETEETLSIEGAKKARLLPIGAVMVTCIGNLGNVSIAGKELATNQQINSIIFNKYVNSKFGYYYILTLKKWLVENSTSTTISMVNKSNFEKAPFILPPRAEQNRIVEKLDLLFENIGRIKAKLYAIPLLLKNFRQAVLSQAVKGNLTERLRKGKQFKEWCLVDAENVFEYVTSGSRGWAPFYDNVLGKQLFVRMTNMSYESLSLNLNKEKLQFLNLPLDLNEGKRTLLRKGDILISITADIGMISFISHDLPYESYINQHICLARPKESYNSQYIAMYLMSESGLGQLRNLKRGVTKAGLSLGDIRSLKINLPPLSEQQEIILQVESLFAKADLIEKQYQVLKSQIDNLPQAILSKAFIGGLVAQNPNDEPASELLERIKETQTLSKQITKLTQVVA
ncbi:restriction endonuclease subunit S [Pedobacter sp. N36a]|uniref:restriction endonuclease subunit S n=1 Tax=Pedobacter sp. N36a TaxID=2767996 RepID=UPI00165709B8|nr:restriction endonuclease subunit S [Pedobacter sp. N36a]MBC8986658.1 restriction endonuclease subunit S [Pedobacter sp. N36a]